MENLPSAVTTLLFDMDNTLFDLVGAQIDACHAVAEHLGQDDGEDLFSCFLAPTHGFESHENIRQYMEERSIPVNGTFRTACQVYERVKLQSIFPYEGIPETLQSLKGEGYLMGIVTDAHSRDATLRLEKAGLLPFFCCIVSFDRVKVKKPAHEPFLFALEMMKAHPGEAVLIGDSPRRDIAPCRSLGIRTVYARYGDRFSLDRDNVPADFIIDTPEELPDIILGLRREPETPLTHRKSGKEYNVDVSGKSLRKTTKT
jgi:putative hydrolase of the HAD superfamily